MSALNFVLGLYAIACACFLIDALRTGAEQRRMERREPRDGYIRANRP